MLENASRETLGNNLPEWYTYIPKNKPSPELILQTFLINCEISKVDPYSNIDKLVELTNFSKDKIEFYINNPDELERIVSEKSV